MEQQVVLTLWPVVSLSITWPWEEITVCCTGQQHAGKYLGQLKPWECLSNRNSGLFYYCTVPFYCVDIVRDVFLWEKCWSSAYLMNWLRLLAGVLGSCLLLWCEHLAFVLPIQFFLRPYTVWIIWYSSVSRFVVGQMTCTDRARNFMLHLLLCFTNHSVSVLKLWGHGR